ncbi:MAG: PAS domain-containing protein [Rhodocyclaceae bacterium]|nr:PAS domain-containing protein [Rhodocyclaceae bacterium]
MGKKHAGSEAGGSGRVDADQAEAVGTGSEGGARKTRDRAKPDHRRDGIGFPVVGIGASAGGLEAFKTFFGAMPPNSGMAFVLVQHLDPTHESMMTDLLAKYTAMRVRQIEDGMPVEPNTVFMIPPNKYLTFKQGKLHLTEPVERRGMRMPIDFLFRSLAEELQEAAICIVLSGTGADGTQGLRMVKGEGGTILAQEPSSAQYDGMPQSAIGTGLVDYVLPPNDMPKALLDYVHHAPAWSDAPERKDAEGKTDNFQAILALLRARTRHDFRCYKQGTLTRRIHRRMGLRQTDGYQDYLKLLRDDPAEVKALLRDLLIGVTSFFRDQDAWKEVESLVIVKLLERKDENDVLRIWVPGCSSGEEAYSLAMLIAEVQARLGMSCSVQIFASDIDEAALEVARNGVYPESITNDVSASRLGRYFESEENRYRVSKHIRDMVVFANQNLVRDPPFSRLDLISCRNLLIYLDANIQKRIINLLHFALKEGGYLFLGPSESVAHREDLFETVSKKWRLYRRIGVVQRQALDFPLIATDEDRRSPFTTGLPREPRAGSVTALAHEVLLREYVPASVIVNRRGEAIYYHGPVSRYLEVVAGEPTRYIAEQARPGLDLKVRSALQRAIRENAEVSMGGKVRGDTSGMAVTIKVRPLEMPASAEGLLLVTFEDVPSVPASLPTQSDVQLPEEVRQLEYELTATREDLQSTIEELETSNEELKASNEEVMSMNEELQSTNEELETSKEELQSLNEELTTVNNQLQDKVQDLESANNDMANLLNSTSIATLFLDRKFQVRRFTQAATRLFRLIPSDVGRSLEDIALRFANGHLMHQARQVLNDLRPQETTVQAEDGGVFLCRILPYRTIDDRIDGVVLTFVDITELKRMEADLRDSEERLRFALDAASDGLWDWDIGTDKVFRSPRYYELVGRRPEEGQDNFEFFKSTVDPRDLEQCLAVIGAHRKGDRSSIDFQYRLAAAGEGVRWMRARGRAVARDSEGQALRIVGTLSDVTHQRQIEEQLRENQARMQQAEALASMGAWDFDLVTKNVWWSDETFRIFGLPPDGPPVTFDRFLERVHPEDRARVSAAYSGSLKDGSGGYEIEHRVVLDDGVVRTVLERCAHVRDASGLAVRSFGMVMDVTAQREAEQHIYKLSQLVEQSPSQILITDLQPRVEFVNEALIRQSGYSREELLGQNPRMLSAGKTPDATYEALWSVLSRGEVWKGELLERHKDGSEFLSRVVISPILDRSGKTANYVAVYEDITEQKRTQEELEQHRAHLQELVDERTADLVEATEQAKAANVAKSAFLANMSHEIRTPLNGVLGMAHLLRKTVVDQRQSTYLDTIERSGRHLLSVLNDILDLSKIEAGKFLLCEANFSLAELLGELAGIYGPLAEEKGVAFQVEPDDAPESLRGDSGRLRQALVNYLGNAIKFTSEGSITLSVRVESEDEAGYRMRFEVQDTGIGIRPDDQARLFRTFEQADQSLTREHGGTGLGLAITRRIAELMGGESGVESTLGRGSRFWISVLLGRGSNDDADHGAPSVSEAILQLQARHSGRRILLVEDEPVNQAVATELLEDVGLMVDLAGDGLQSVAMAAAQDYPVILMDMQMPNLDGLDATRQIRALPGRADTPIIAMTANAYSEDAQRCMEAGMSDFLSKPVSPDVLYAVLLKWLDRA